MMEFTNAQLEAIRCRGGSVLVSAGAGSGKTRVLTERLMEYMDPQLSEEKPEDIDRFLVITFTRAAAGELKARIADAIARRLRENPTNMHLRRQLLLCRSAQIGTIHSFCASILREYAGVLGISPAFRILEEEKSERLRASALERVLERLYGEGSEAFLQLSSRVGAGRDDSRLADLILKLHANMQSHARPFLWAEQQLREFSSGPEHVIDTLWGRELLDDTGEEAAFWLSQMETAIREMQAEECICRAYEASFSATADALRLLCRKSGDGWDAATECFPIPFPRISGIKNNPNPDLSDRLKSTRERCKKAMEKLAAVYSVPESKVLKDLQSTAPEMNMLLDTVLALEEEFQKAKNRADALDFSDLEHLAIRLLTREDGTPTEAAREISSRFREVLVDEYQDVSRVQDQIFQAVSRNGSNLFFVGDLKQSIYRFRLADPEVFHEKSLLFEENAEGGRVIRLQENFRSRPAILRAVNGVFCRCMSERLGNLDYSRDDMLIPGSPSEDPGTVPELLLLPREEAENTELEEEAALAAKEILKLVGNAKVRDGDSRRPARFSDVAILLRSANAVGGVFRRVLLASGIPVSAGSGSDFYSSVEVSTVFSMLSVMDNPHRDIPLITLLSSPAYGFNPEKLSMIRAESTDSDFYGAVCASEDQDAAAFVSQLRRLRDDTPDLNPVELINRIVDELDLYAIASAMTDGEQRIQRLMDLSAMAETFRQSGEYGLHRFVQWLRNMERKNRDPETCSDDSDAVHILSIHRSKGLEFPIVFFCGVGRQFNRQDTRDIVLVHPELGFGPKYTDPERKIEYPTAARRAIERRITRDMLSEEMRLLYVAMTRAKDYLILTACVSKIDEQLEKASQLQYDEKIPAVLLESSSNALPWLLPTALEQDVLRFRICTGSGGEAVRTDEKDEQADQPDQELLSALDRNLRFVYRHSRAEFLPSKLTATELKTADPDAAPLIPRHSEFRVPDLSRKTLAAARIGTATHLVLQQISFSHTGSVEEIRAEISRLEQQHFLTHEEAEAVDAKKIQAFFDSEIGRRILCSEQVWREFRFSLMTDVRELLKEETGEEKILLQGVVDCCFLENGELVLLDYKTDGVFSDSEIKERSEHYRIQLETYAGALERIFGCRVKERWLYFLRPETAVALT